MGWSWGRMGNEKLTKRTDVQKMDGEGGGKTETAMWIVLKETRKGGKNAEKSSR